MKWVTMWGNAQSTVLPAPATYAKDVTFRYPILVPFKGSKIRITFDNFCCEERVTIDCAYISTGKTLNDQQETLPIELTVKGNQQFTIEAFSSVISDEINLEVEAGSILLISFYLKDFTKLTSGVDIVGPLSKGYFAYGNQTKSKALEPNTSKATSWVYFLSNVDIFTEDQNEAIICYGDSITSQDWPDYLYLSLKENGYHNYSVVRKAVSGTRILREYSCITYQSYGKHGHHRFLHEISSVSGANIIIIQHGINDIIHPVGVEINPFRPMSDLPTVEELIKGLKYYQTEAEKLGLQVYFGTLLPIYNWRTYAPFREKLKNDVNLWIRKQSHIDFEKKVGIYNDEEVHFKEGFDSGDHLHPSKKAYEEMGKLAAATLIKCKKSK